MGLLSWLFGKKEAEEEAEPLVLGARLKCEYGSQPSYLFVESEDIDLNNLPQACIKDSKALVNILPFGSCSFNHECSISMWLQDEWENEEPQKVLANGYPILTKKHSKIICLRTGMEIRPITTGQDGIFAKQLQFLRQMDLDYPGLCSILEDPYGSLYLDPGAYQMALKFLKDMMNSEGEEFELIYLYDPNNVKGLYMKAAMERLLVNCNFKSHELLMESLMSEAIQNNLLDVDGWDKNYLNKVLMEFIDEEAREYAAKVAAGGIERWSEEHKMLTNWAAESVYSMAYGTMVYSHIKAAQAKMKQEKQYEDKASKERKTKDEGATTKVNPNEIRFSQSSVNGAEELTSSMKANGWKGDPIDVVEMADGQLTTIDNTRVAAARQAGIDVQANIHGYSDPLPSEFVDRFTTKKGVPTTWGEAMDLRIGKQNSTFRNTYPSGSFDMPKLNN